MMIATLLLAAAAQSPIDEEMVVIAQLLQPVEVALGRSDAGKIICGVRQSSGYARLDGMTCKDSAICLEPMTVSSVAVEGLQTARKPQLIERIVAQLRKKRNSNA